LDKTNEIISATSLLYSVANADNIIEENEVKSIKEIIIDFFRIKENYDIDYILNVSKEKYLNAIDIFQFSKELNKQWTYQDKIDFICCTFEVAFSDGSLHYLEESAIKNIAIILNVNFQDLIKSKIEMKKYLS
tara:strand:- start:1328 stop:1726 length:399 start_codon:yes stop_codon:yes gene_type:complete